MQTLVFSILVQLDHGPFVRVVSEGRTVISPSELFVNISLTDCSRLQHLAKQSKPRILRGLFTATTDTIWSLPDPFSRRLNTLWPFPKIVATVRLPDGSLLSVAFCVIWAFSQLCLASIRLATRVAIFVDVKRFSRIRRLAASHIFKSVWYSWPTKRGTEGLIDRSMKPLMVGSCQKRVLESSI